MIHLLVVTDGRPYIADTIASLEEQVTVGIRADMIGRRVIHDDSGDPQVHARLAAAFPRWELVTTRRRSGFGGAYRHAWGWLAERVDTARDWVFSTEDDFTFNLPVDITDLAYVLETNPWLAQMALRRQAWNEQERAAGGVVESNPLAYTEYDNSAGHRWLEHRLFWTTNPSLHRAALLPLRWPDGAQSEGRWARHLLDHGLPWGVPGDAVRFGYWGGRAEGEWVTHIGHQRAGKGY